jgi:ABC-2 type transport system permease protein
MAANRQLERVHGWGALRGFSNLYRKEHRAWWGTRRWWTNGLLWTVLLCGLMAIMLFVPNEEAREATEAELSQAGGLVGYVLMVGLTVFFEFGVPVLAVWTVVLVQDSIIGEKQSGVVEWLLSKPVRRRAYVLAKLAANALGVLLVLVGLPSLIAYGMLTLRLGELYPWSQFLPAVGIMALNTLFYLTLTLMLGTIFNSRGPVLGITLGSILGGGMLGNLMEPLFYVTPWTLPKLAWLTATGQALPTEMGIAALVATTIWSMMFIVFSVVNLERMEC